MVLMVTENTVWAAAIWLIFLGPRAAKPTRIATQPSFVVVEYAFNRSY